MRIAHGENFNVMTQVYNQPKMEDTNSERFKKNDDDDDDDDSDKRQRRRRWQ